MILFLGYPVETHKVKLRSYLPMQQSAMTFSVGKKHKLHFMSGRIMAHIISSNSQLNYNIVNGANGVMMLYSISWSAAPKMGASHAGSTLMDIIVEIGA